MGDDIHGRSEAVPGREEVQELMRLVTGFRVSQAIYVVARLGIVDLLADGPRESDDLARTAGANSGALYRLLRFLAGVGLFDEVDPRSFALTPLGATLRTADPGTRGATAYTLVDPPHWQAWGQLLHSVRTGEPAFDSVYGMGLFDYLAAHPDEASGFNALMSSNASQTHVAITQAYDFSGIRTLVDVGGGHGALLASVLRAHPTMRGVLFDLPEVVAGAAPMLDAAAIADRCDVVAGDMFSAVPAGGDAYVLRQIVHDWDDDRATAILANCRRAMAETGGLLVIERGVDPDNRRALPELHLDLQMLVMNGGRQRTDAEYAEIFAAAGFALTRVVPLGDALHYNIYEGVPV